MSRFSIASLWFGAPGRRAVTRLAGSLLILVLLAAGTLPLPATTTAAPVYSTEFVRWRAATGGFAGWTRDGVDLLADGTLLPIEAGGAADGYDGVIYSPVMPVAGEFTEAIPSWNAETPPGTSIEVFLRARRDHGWTGWYSLGVWASGGTGSPRASVGGQRDVDGRVATDTLVLTGDPADAFQVSVTFTGGYAESFASLRNLAVSLSNGPYGSAPAVAGRPSRWNRSLAVPTCSQMVYPDGGRVWCSPTSTAMVLAYWEGYDGPCEPAVRAAVAEVYDPVYRGHGNWSFNTAYAASRGYEAYVARFASLAQVEAWIAAGIPVIASLAWQPGELPNASISWTSGHLLVITGFDASGNPIVNDPAASRGGLVRRVYPRAQFESLWQADTGGTVYLIYPSEWPVPAL